MGLHICRRGQAKVGVIAYAPLTQRNNSTVDNLKTRVALLENILSSSGAGPQLGAIAHVHHPPPAPIPRIPTPPSNHETIGAQSSGLTPFLGSSPDTATSNVRQGAQKRVHSATSPHDEFSQTEHLKVCLPRRLRLTPSDDEMDPSSTLAQHLYGHTIDELPRSARPHYPPSQLPCLTGDTAYRRSISASSSTTTH